MISIPILGRLSLNDYARIATAFFVKFVEVLLRFVIALFPFPSVVDYVRFEMMG